MTEEIPPGLSAEETLDIIEDQGALSIVPHPFCTFRSTAIDREVLFKISDRVDIIEGYNARTPGAEENHMGRVFAKKCGKPVSVGSDAHTPVELARNYVRIENFSTPAELLQNLRQAEINFSPAPPGVNEFTIMFKRMRMKSGNKKSLTDNIEAAFPGAGI